MKSTTTTYATIDEYLASYPKEIRGILEKIRSTIKKAAPQAEELISYGIPAFKQKGVLVYFAAFKNHFSLFPTMSATSKFKKELAKYECSKGTVRFPLGTEIPYSLITKIVKFRVRENIRKTANRRKA
jgi:uncharacterized protein YdhG (YjbR/CyaY superfamily)